MVRGAVFVPCVLKMAAEGFSHGFSNEIVVFNIEDVGVNVNIDAKWGVGSHLLVYGTSPCVKTKVEHIGPHTSRQPSAIHRIQWDTSLCNDLARKMVGESDSIFLALQKLTAEGKSESTRPQLVKISRRYRSIIKAFVDDLRHAADETYNDSTREEYECLAHVYYKMELIWNLCEILFLDVQPSGALLNQLLDWLRWHFPIYEMLAKEVTESDDPASHPSYWNAVYGYVLQGRITDVRKLLHVHPDSRSETFLLVDQLLRQMPLHSYFASESSYDFIFHWQHWREECLQRLEHGEFSISPPLEKVCNLLCGTMETYEQMRELSETWYHLMVSRLLFTNPCVKVTELHHLALAYVDLFGGLSTTDELDRILLAALELNVLEVIKQSSQHFDSWWFVAHLTDLLHHADMLHDGDGGEVTLREFLLSEYACSLTSHVSMWEFAIDYFDQCPMFGRQKLELCVERIPLTSEWVANRVLHIALQRDMQDLARTTCKVMGRRALCNNRLGVALSWALKSKDSTFVTYLADEFLIEYGRRGRFHSLALLDNLGSSVLVSDRLTFLCKYREFHQLYANKSFHHAASILVQLLTSKLAPKSFWKPLLLDSLPLLESDEVIFDMEQTFELLRCLEELLPSTLDETLSETEKTREQLIRFALGRNLARTFTQEADAD